MLNIVELASHYGIYCIVSPWTGDQSSSESVQFKCNSFCDVLGFRHVSAGAEPNALFDLWNEQNGRVQYLVTQSQQPQEFAVT